MHRKWYSSWDPEVPRDFEPQKSFAEYFKETVDRLPENIAITYYGKDITYRELDRLVDKFAGGLISLGLKKGDRVALLMQNCPQFAISFIGTLKAGGVVVALNPMFKHVELEYELKDSGTKILVALDSLFPEVQRIEGKLQIKDTIITSMREYVSDDSPIDIPAETMTDKTSFPDTIDFQQFLSSAPLKESGELLDIKKDMALLQYTGGTTGMPKAAIITHYALACATSQTILWCHWNSENVYLVVVPIFHTFGMIHGLSAPLQSGGRLVLLARFVVKTAAQAINHYGCNIWPTSPTMIIALLNWPELNIHDISKLRYVGIGGAPMPESYITKLVELVPEVRIREGMGFSETSSGTAIVSPFTCMKPGYIGIPNISSTAKIVDLKSGKKKVPPGEEGEIAVKGKSMMTGYWNKPEETKNALRRGWFYTGDIGKMDEDGWFAVIGRKKEMIKCSGFSVFPAEVEELLYRHPAIESVAVIGVPDSYRGETPKAFVVLKDKYKGKITADDILAWAKDNMATYKRPRLIEFRDELPKSGAGKILRRVLADQDKNIMG